MARRETQGSRAPAVVGDTVQWETQGGAADFGPALRLQPSLREQADQLCDALRCGGPPTAGDAPLQCPSGLAAARLWRPKTAS
eukprot:scaffold57411_cov65-Phaeocystis_antarctica.AAC.4